MSDQRDDSNLILFSSAKETATGGRGAMVIWRSTNEGRDWEEARTIWPESMAMGAAVTTLGITASLTAPAQARKISLCWATTAITRAKRCGGTA